MSKSGIGFGTLDWVRLDARFHEGHFAVNVKTYHLTFPGAPPFMDATEQQEAWDRASSRWWEAADNVGRALGFHGVSAEGRSGGWLVPMLAATQYVTQEAMLGDRELRVRCNRLDVSIRKLLRQAPGILKDEYEEWAHARRRSILYRALAYAASNVDDIAEAMDEAPMNETEIAALRDEVRVSSWPDSRFMV